MRKFKSLFGILIAFGVMSGAMIVDSITQTTSSITIDSKGIVTKDISYQATGTIGSIADISNGNLKASLSVSSLVPPDEVKSQLLDGSIQIGDNSQFIVKTGTPILDNPKTKTFDVNETDSTQPSVLITRVGKTQTGENLDVLVSLQKVSGTTPGNSTLTIDENQSDGSIDIGEANLATVQVAYQFQDTDTHQPVKLLLFPVIGDIDGNQQISLNGEILAHGSNLTETASGLFASDSTLTNGFADFPLGGLLYEFYGDTMVSNFNTTSDGTAVNGGVGYGIFGAYGSVKNIQLNYPNSTVSLNFFNSFTKQPIQASQVHTGMIYSPYSFNVPSFSGYQFNSSLTDISKLNGTYAPNNTDIRLYYDKESSITVNYLDSQTKQPLQNAQTLSGMEGQSYQITAPTIANYRLNKTLSNLTGTYDAENRTITLYYDKKSTIVLQAVGEDSHGNKTPLQTLATLTGYVGDAYSQALPHLQNYKFPSAPATGTFTENDQNIDIIYLKEQGAVSVNYIDQSNQQQLLPTLNISDNIGDNQIIRAPFIPNYTAQNSTGSDALFTQLLPFQTVNVNYLPNQEKITVNFEDNTGHSLRFPLTLAGAYGTSGLYKAPPISGYDLAPGQVQNINLHFTQPNSALTIRYQHTQGSEHFIFEDENGEQVAQPQTISGDVDSSYNVVAPYVKYLKISNPKQRILSGKYSTQKQTVIVKYTHLKAKLTVYGVDDRGNQVNHQVFTGLEGDTKTVQMPKFRTLQLKNGKYQHFATRLNSQNQTIFVLYKHIKSTLTVNLKVDGVVKSHFSVTGFIGDKFSMKLPTSKTPTLVGGASHISGEYTQAHQSYDVNYHYKRSTITYNLYDSAGDYITSRSLSGEYGQAFNYTLPTYVTDGYGYTYYAEFNIHQQGYFGAENENHDVVYQYTGPHGTYEQTAHHPYTNPSGETYSIKLSSVQKEDAQFERLATQLHTTAENLQLQLLSSSGNIIVGGKEYIRGYTIDQWGNTVMKLVPVASSPSKTTPSHSSSNASNNSGSGSNHSYSVAPPQHDTIYVPAARNFWRLAGTTGLQSGSFFSGSSFSLVQIGGRWYYLSGTGVNEKQSNHGLEKFLLESGSNVITGVQAAQTAAAIFFTPETGGGSDALDVLAIGAENGAKDAIKSEIEKIAEEDGAAGVAEEDVSLEVNNAIDSVSDNTVNHIMQGHHDWSKVVEEPTWKNVKPLVQEVMENGEESPYRNVYQRQLQIGDEKITVTYNKVEGQEKISDAWVNYDE